MTTEERAPPRRGIGCLLLAMVALALFGLLGVQLVASGTVDDDGIVEEVESAPADARRKLVVVEIKGVISDEPGRTTEHAVKMLDRAREDDAVAGVLLQIDSPGGSVTDSDLVHRAVTRVREKEKPVVVLMGDLCASGGFYVASAADAIYALPTTVTGSIGVIVFGLNVHELLGRIGVQDVSVMSGDYKDLLSPTRPVDEQERQLMQEIVDAMHRRFVDLVAQGRKLPPAEVRAHADGRLFTADQAKARRLIDEVGYREEALDRLRDLASGGPFQIVRYHRRAGWLDLLRDVDSTPRLPGLALLRHLESGPRVMYLYSPLGIR